MKHCLLSDIHADKSSMESYLITSVRLSIEFEPCPVPLPSGYSERGGCEANKSCRARNDAVYKLILKNA